MLRLYRHLLYLYPASYRREFADEMATVFCEAGCYGREIPLTA